MTPPVGTPGIRLARPADARQVAAVYSYYVATSTASFDAEAPSSEHFLRMMPPLESIYPFIIFTQGDEILGYAYARPISSKAGYSWSVESTIYLRDDVLGRGLGTLLYRALTETLRYQGFLNCYACVTVPNEASHKLHTHFGFKRVGLWPRAGYKFGQWYDAEWLCLSLAAHIEKPAPVTPISRVPEQELRNLYNDILSSWQNAYSTRSSC